MATLIEKITGPGSGPSDRFLIGTTGVLAAFGIVVVFSAISYMAGPNIHWWLGKHVMYTSLALVVMVLVSRIDYHVLAKWGKLLLVIAIGLLVFVHLFGEVRNGARRWIFGFQPSEVARVALLLHIAYLLARKQLYIDNLEHGFAPLLFWILPVALLIGIEDFSTAGLLLTTIFIMCLIGRVRIAHLAGLGMVLLLCATPMLMSSPARQDRLISWLGMMDEEKAPDLQDKDYQTHQAEIAFSLGGISGVGAGKSTQRDFLPAPYNDFIYAIVAEEYGLIGALGVLLLFGIVLFRGFLRVARDAPDPLGLFLAVGVTTMIVLYGFINAGVACGLMPVTGLPLPFVSYGGTALVANGALMGILLNISRIR